jgi:hypothetical protein
MVFSENLCYKTWGHREVDKAMIRDVTIYSLLLLILILGQVPGQPVFAQDFPYIAPQAPEFDNRGNHLERVFPRSSSPVRGQERRPVPTDNAMRSDYPPIQQESPQVGLPIVPGPLFSPQAPTHSRSQDGQQKFRAPISPSQIPEYTPPRVRPPTVASTPPDSSAQIQELSDCSQYPILIAGARSENEMQFTARRYLTCLVQNGWNEDQARQQVIRIIETSFRPPR